MSDALDPAVDDDDDVPPFDVDSPGDAMAVPGRRMTRQERYAAGRRQLEASGIDMTLPDIPYPKGLNNAGKQIYAQIAEAWHKDPEEGRRTFLGMAMPGALLSTMRAANGEPPFEKPQRWAVRAILEIGKVLGAQNEIRVVLELAQEYGLKSEAELRQRLELATRVRDVNLETAQARATELLRRIIAADPSRRATIRTELFGEMDATPDPVANLPAKAAPVKRGPGRPVAESQKNGYVYDPTVSRYTDYLRRKKAGLVGPKGRPRKKREA